MLLHSAARHVFLTQSREQRNQAILRLAVASLMNGSCSASDRDAALALAKQAGITFSEYLRARLLLQAAATRPVEGERSATNEFPSTLNRAEPS